jgi:hypothetical protein
MADQKGSTMLGFAALATFSIGVTDENDSSIGTSIIEWLMLWRRRGRR